jgi:16S rRNA (uracil1498-N3)-methyltransferase
MATELGAARIVPLITARTVVRMETGRTGSRLARWQRVAKEAAKQSGRGIIPELASPVGLVAWLAQSEPSGLLVCLWEGAPAPLGPQLPPPPCPRATLVVGPEGGLGHEEVEALRRAGAICGGLGPRILRTETAGPVGLALLQSRYGDLTSAAS